MLLLANLFMWPIARLTSSLGLLLIMSLRSVFSKGTSNSGILWWWYRGYLRAVSWVSHICGTRRREHCIDVRWTIVLEECLAIFRKLINSLFRLEHFPQRPLHKLPSLSGILSIRRKEKLYRNQQNDLSYFEMQCLS